MNFLLLLLGLVLLLAGGTSLVSGASRIAGHYGVSPLVVGLTVVAFGTSAPELVVNVVGSFRGETALAFGNVAGSNLANLGLVLGLSALITPVAIQGQIVRREVPLLLLGSAVLFVMALDGPLNGSAPLLSRSDGVILLLLFSIFVYITASDFLHMAKDPVMDEMRALEASLPSPRASGTATHVVYIAAGILGLSWGAHLTITNGAQLAQSLGISPVVVGLVIVAVGTSLPELVTSVIAARRKESDLCVGNVVGSNIFNGLFVLPISALVRPLPLPEGGLVDILLSLLFTAAVILVFFYGKARMDRKTGVVFISCYLAYMAYRALF